MEIKSHRHPMVDYMYIIVGTTILAMSINVFFDPLNLVTGGVTGFAIVLKSMTTGLVTGGIPIYITNLVVNIPLFVLALIIKGKNFGARSLFATSYLSFALFYTGGLEPLTYNPLLGALFGGVVAGIGLGLVFAAFSTTGGTDLMATLIQQVLKHVSVANIMLVLDAVIILFGLFVFGVDKAMYAIIAVYISARIIDTMLEGIHFSKAAFIISKKNDAIASAIMENLERGVTGLEGFGKFTKKEREVLLCVVSKREIVKLKEIVRDIDFNAFVIVADVREVVGEGFIEYEASKKNNKK